MEEFANRWAKSCTESRTNRRRLRMTNKSNNQIYIITHKTAPNVMRRSGRLREIAFVPPVEEPAFRWISTNTIRWRILTSSLSYGIPKPRRYWAVPLSAWRRYCFDDEGAPPFFFPVSFFGCFHKKIFASNDWVGTFVRYFGVLVNHCRNERTVRSWRLVRRTGLFLTVVMPMWSVLR